MYIYMYICTHPAALLIKPIQRLPNFFSQPIRYRMVARCSSRGSAITKGKGVKKTQDFNPKAMSNQACAFRALMKYRKSDKCVKAMQR